MTCIYLSSPPYVLHALPVVSFFFWSPEWYLSRRFVSVNSFLKTIKYPTCQDSSFEVCFYHTSGWLDARSPLKDLSEGQIRCHQRLDFARSVVYRIQMRSQSESDKFRNLAVLSCWEFTVWWLAYEGLDIDSHSGNFYPDCEVCGASKHWNTVLVKLMIVSSRIVSN
jgi:hypothetical protein